MLVGGALLVEHSMDTLGDYSGQLLNTFSQDTPLPQSSLLAGWPPNTSTLKVLTQYLYRNLSNLPNSNKSGGGADWTGGMAWHSKPV